MPFFEDYHSVIFNLLNNNILNNNSFRIYLEFLMLH